MIFEKQMSVATRLIKAPLRRPYYAIRRTVLGWLNRHIFHYRFIHRADVVCAVASARTTGSSTDDSELIDRIINAYRRSVSAAVPDPNSMWGLIFNKVHVEIHNALLKGPRSRVEEILRDPGTSNLFFGFENLCRSNLGESSQQLGVRLAPGLAADALLACAEAIGARRIENPAKYNAHMPRPPCPNLDDVLHALDSKLGVMLPIPNPFPREFGASTRRGVISYRVPQAIYQAWRLRERAVNLSSPRILEVGAGLGRTAFYAHILGLTDYTIVDIPISAVAQGYFLGRALGADRVTLEGEPRRPGVVAIQSPETFYADSTRYQVVLNADGLTEMDPAVARAYWAAFQQRTDGIISINHENNPFTVQELINTSGPHARVTRTPSWTRRGYVENEVVFNRT